MARDVIYCCSAIEISSKESGTFDVLWGGGGLLHVVATVYSFCFFIFLDATDTKKERRERQREREETSFWL